MKVKVRFAQGVNEAARQSLLGILSINGVKCSKILTQGDGFSVVCNSPADADTIFSDKCSHSLQSQNFDPVLPAELKSKRTIILKRLDISLYNCENALLVEEIESANSWLTVKELYKFTKSKTIKLLCANQDMATKALEHGILAFNLSIPPRDISEDKFIKITTCYKCYALNDHLVQDCPKGQHYKICSMCSSTEHTFKECKADTKCCLLCGGDHCAMAFSCPKRKEITLRDRQSSAMSIPFSSVAKIGTSVPLPSGGACVADATKSIIKSTMCLLVAGMKNVESPGSFECILNSLLIVNDLPEFKFGDVQPPNITTITNLLRSSDTLEHRDLNAEVDGVRMTSAPHPDDGEVSESSDSEGSAGSSADVSVAENLIDKIHDQLLRSGSSGGTPASAAGSRSRGRGRGRNQRGIPQRVYQKRPARSNAS
jgi:hypothetical protein